MAKVLSPKKKKQRSRLLFTCFLMVYALIFMGAAIYGLDYLWSFLDAYEQSRPYHAVDAYMENLTAEYVCGYTDDLIAQVDSSVQTEEESRAVILEALSGGITHAKKTSECTESKLVYVLRSGGQVIGEVIFEQQGESVHGFTPWAMTSDSFDMSFLLTGTVSVTVPQDFPVYVNGYLLDDSHITETNIPYEYLTDYYAEYELPYKVSYAAGPCLGQIGLQATTPDGTPMTIDENTDLSVYMENCTEEEVAQLNDLVQAFTKRYVAFSSSNRNNVYTNYNALKKYLVSNGDLVKRLNSAIAGLAWGQSQKDVITQITIHHCIRLNEERYMCDYTYLVDSTGNNGVVTTTTNMKLMIVVTDDGLRVESISNY